MIFSVYWMEGELLRDFLLFRWEDMVMWLRMTDLWWWRCMQNVFWGSWWWCLEIECLFSFDEEWWFNIYQILVILKLLWLLDRRSLFFWRLVIIKICVSTIPYICFRSRLWLNLTIQLIDKSLIHSNLSLNWYIIACVNYFRFWENILDFYEGDLF